MNPRSGDDRPSAEDLRDEAEKRGVRVHLLGDGDDLAQLTREADALGVAGGDGSLATVADVAIERDLPLSRSGFTRGSSTAAGATGAGARRWPVCARSRCWRRTARRRA